MEKDTTFQECIEIAKRRKWWIIIPFMIVVIGSFPVYKILPKTYLATTLILVQPQQIPTDYVQSTVSLSVSDRLATISQQILSRTSLEEVITQLHLIKNPSDPSPMSKKVDSMRKATKIDVHRGGDRDEQTSAFAISFEDRNPADAARIVNKIAALFITENLKVREKQARGTSQFLEKELKDIEEKLEQKEESIRSFKEMYMGELPAQLEANLRILERLQQEVQTNNQSMIAAQQRRANLETQIDQMRTAMAQEPTENVVAKEDPLVAQLNKQRGHLETLLTQYTDHHPDVIAAKASIENLEAQLRLKQASEARMGEQWQTNPEAQEKPVAMSPMLTRLSTELQEVIVQIQRLKGEEADLKNQISIYQHRVEKVPKREEEMSTLLRDYSLLQASYQSLLDKKLQAQLAENLERRQQGEQFKILDPATPPMFPFKPKRNRFFALAFILGTGLGVGLAFLREHADRSFHKAEDVEQFLGFPVVATIPKISTGGVEKIEPRVQSISQ